ncbi:outer membrane beta-barrel family protein [Chitinophaga eiseniae]|uniref:Outer membrane beta-barrel protein n=1 Tax=Chitinophaga eiseniae TaxID=634771 RepID=A0A847SLF1_9BACT|nr:outer membrane beta-barrel family protein [Chitinophaga eiseniae]NLR82771.1 outer membrane beta-barrel protein [Chitinophaga eiseniae]
MTGKITSTHGQPMGYATISLLAHPDSTIVTQQLTDSVGAFTFNHIRNGRYWLRCLAMGYETVYRDISVTNNTPLHTGNITMTPVSSLLGEVVVSGSQPSIQRVNGKLVLNISGNRLFKADVNVLSILKKVPGLEVDGEGAIQLSGRVTPAIFINGKPTTMNAAELQHYLSSLSPDMISSIEVDATPSARFDAEHKAIINIQLKQDINRGWNGSISSSVQQNAYTQANNNLLLQYNTSRITYTARLGYINGNTHRRYQALQHLASTDVLTTHTHTVTRYNDFSYQLGAAYHFRKNQQLEITGRAYQANQGINSVNTLLSTDAAGKKVVFSTYTGNNAAPKRSNYAADIYYNGQAGNNSWQVLTTIARLKNRNAEEIQTYDALNSQLQQYWKTNLNNDIVIRSIQADFTHQAGNARLIGGGKFAYTTTQNNIRYDTLNTTNQFEWDSSRSNNFLYREYISAGYLSYEGKFRKFSYSAGLRAEYTRSVANSLTTLQITTRNYLTWLPSATITFAVNEQQQYQLSFTSKMTRPNFVQLNPFRFYNSPLNYWIGNPYLLASTTRTLSLSYSNGPFNISGNIGRELLPMARYPEYNPVTNVLEYLGTNLPYSDFADIEAGFPIKVNQWWHMNYNLGGHYRKELNPYHQVTYAIPILDYTINSSQVFTLPYRFTLYINYYYKSVSGNSLYISRPMSNFDVGLQRTWLKEKLNTKINVYDLFDTYRVRFIFREKSIIDNQLSHWFGTRRAVFTLSYQLGKAAGKSPKSTKNEEEGRANM